MLCNLYYRQDGRSVLVNTVSPNRRTVLEAVAALPLIRSTRAVEATQRPPAPESEDAVVELRQYTLRGGQRDVLIALFEKNFIEPQLAVGANVLGLFRDLDDPDRFVWIRGYRDMATRQAALAAFYGGPVWLANRAAANATILDSDNVLLLRPAEPGLGVLAHPAAASGGVIGGMIYYLGGVDSTQFARVFAQVVMPHLISAGAHPVGQLVTNEVVNNFPRLPIREHDRTFVWLAQWPNVPAEEAFVASFRALSGWRDSVPEAVLPALMQKPERLRLAPTLRSALR